MICNDKGFQTLKRYEQLIPNLLNIFNKGIHVFKHGRQTNFWSKLTFFCILAYFCGHIL